MKRLGVILAVTILGVAVALWAGPASAARTVVHDLVQGTETSTGVVVGDTRQGVTFSGTATGTLAGTFTVVVSYTPAQPACGGTNQLAGGTFVFQTAGGSLTGLVTSGSVRFDPFCAFGLVSATLDVTGGSGTFAGAHGRGTFSGTLNHLPLLIGQPATITGTLDLAVNTPGGHGQ